MKLTFFEKNLFDESAIEKPSVSTLESETDDINKIKADFADPFVSLPSEREFRKLNIPVEVVPFFKTGSKETGKFKKASITSGEPEILSKTEAPLITKDVSVDFEGRASTVDPRERLQPIETIIENIFDVPATSLEPIVNLSVGGRQAKNFINGFSDTSLSDFRSMLQSNDSSSYYSKETGNVNLTARTPESELPEEIYLKESSNKTMTFNFTRNIRIDTKVTLNNSQLRNLIASSSFPTGGNVFNQETSFVQSVNFTATVNYKENLSIKDYMINKSEVIAPVVTKISDIEISVTQDNTNDITLTDSQKKTILNSAETNDSVLGLFVELAKKALPVRKYYQAILRTDCWFKRISGGVSGYRPNGASSLGTRHPLGVAFPIAHTLKRPFPVRLTKGIRLILSENEFNALSYASSNLGSVSLDEGDSPRVEDSYDLTIDDGNLRRGWAHFTAEESTDEDWAEFQRPLGFGGPVSLGNGANYLSSRIFRSDFLPQAEELDFDAEGNRGLSPGFETISTDEDGQETINATFVNSLNEESLNNAIENIKSTVQTSINNGDISFISSNPSLRLTPNEQEEAFGTTSLGIAVNGRRRSSLSQSSEVLSGSVDNSQTRTDIYKLGNINFIATPLIDLNFPRTEGYTGTYNINDLFLNGLLPFPFSSANRNFEIVGMELSTTGRKTFDFFITKIDPESGDYVLPQVAPTSDNLTAPDIADIRILFNGETIDAEARAISSSTETLNGKPVRRYKIDDLSDLIKVEDGYTLENLYRQTGDLNNPLNSLSAPVNTLSKSIAIIVYNDIIRTEDLAPGDYGRRSLLESVDKGFPIVRLADLAYSGGRFFLSLARSENAPVPSKAFFDSVTINGVTFNFSDSQYKPFIDPEASNNRYKAKLSEYSWEHDDGTEILPTSENIPIIFSKSGESVTNAIDTTRLVQKSTVRTNEYKDLPGIVNGFEILDIDFDDTFFSVTFKGGVTSSDLSSVAIKDISDTRYITREMHASNAQVTNENGNSAFRWNDYAELQNLKRNKEYNLEIIKNGANSELGFFVTQPASGDFHFLKDVLKDGDDLRFTLQKNGSRAISNQAFNSLGIFNADNTRVASDKLLSDNLQKEKEDRNERDYTFTDMLSGFSFAEGNKLNFSFEVEDYPEFKIDVLKLTDIYFDTIAVLNTNLDDISISDVLDKDLIHPTDIEEIKEVKEGQLRHIVYFLKNPITTPNVILKNRRLSGLNKKRKIGQVLLLKKIGAFSQGPDITVSPDQGRVVSVNQFSKRHVKSKPESINYRMAFPPLTNNKDLDLAQDLFSRVSDYDEFMVWVSGGDIAPIPMKGFRFTDFIKSLCQNEFDFKYTDGRFSSGITFEILTAHVP